MMHGRCADFIIAVYVTDVANPSASTPLGQCVYEHVCHCGQFYR